MNLFCFLLFLAGTCGAGGQNSAVGQARAFYDAGRYTESVDAYARLAADSPRDAALRYDLGNALFKAGRLGPAIASYERAFVLDPRDRAIRFNLSFALRRAGEDLVPPGVPHPLFRVFTTLSEREASGLHWAFAWLTSFLAAAIFLWPSRRHKLWSLLFSCGAAWLMFGLWWAGLRSALPPDRAVIIATRAEVRNGPGANFSPAFTIPEGRLVRVVNSAGGWLEITVLKEGARGWVESSSVERL